jgi:hypothetical protein
MTTAKSKDQKESKESESAAETYFRAYEGYSTLLRTWLVAYGIGAPALLFTNDHLASAVSKSPFAAEIVWFFLIGVGLHVFLAAINKNVMWVLYWGVQSGAHSGFWYEVSLWINSQYWIDIIVDVACLLLFGRATFLALRVVLG